MKEAGCLDKWSGIDVGKCVKSICNVVGIDLVFELQAEPALVYDSVQVFAHGLAALDRSHVLRPANLSCEREEPWDDGLSLYNYINSVSKTVYKTFFPFHIRKLIQFFY